MRTQRSGSFPHKAVLATLSRGWMRRFGLLMLVAATLASAQEFDPPNTSHSDRPHELEGNWFVEWHDYPEQGQITHAAATLSRRWEQVCVEVKGGACRYAQRLSQTDRGWYLGYSISPFENDGGLQLAADAIAPNGRLNIQWGYHTLGHWGGQSELQQIAPDLMQGQWKYGETGGLEVWRRALPRVDRVELVAKSASESRPAGAPGKVHLDWWGEGESRYVGAEFALRIFGQNLWGHHHIHFAETVDVELSLPFDHVIRIDGSTTAKEPNPFKVAGISAHAMMRQFATPGSKTLYIDGQVIPFELVLDGYPPGRAYFENVLGGQAGDWAQLPASYKQKYAQSEAAEKQAADNVLRLQSQATQDRLEDEALQASRMAQRNALDEKLAAIDAQESEQEEKSTRRKQQQDLLDQRDAIAEELQQYNQRILDAKARNDTQTVKRLSREADALHAKSHELFEPTPAEAEEMARQQNVRDELSRRIHDYVQHNMETELMVTEQLQDSKEAFTGLAKWLSEGAELQEQTKETTRRANRELAAARLAQRRIQQLLDDPRTTLEQREILNDAQHLFTQKEYGAAEHLTSNAMLSATGYGIDVITTVSGGKLVTLGKKGVTAAAKRLMFEESAEKFVKGTTETGVLNLAGQGITKAATKSTEKIVGSQAGLKVEQALTYDVGQAAGRVGKSAATTILGDKGVETAKGIASRSAATLTANLADVPGKFKQLVKGTPDQAQGLTQDLAAGGAQRTAAGAADQATTKTSSAVDPVQAPRRAEVSPMDLAQPPGASRKGTVPSHAERAHGDRTMAQQRLADYARNPHARTLARPGQVDDFPRNPVSAQLRREDFVQARSAWKRIPQAQREAFDQQVRDAIDEAAAMGDKWAKRLQKDLNSGKIKYEFEPGLLDNGLAPGKGSVLINPLKNKSTVLDHPDTVASTLIHEYTHSWKGPKKFKAEQGMPYSGAATKGQYNEVRAFMAEASFNKNLRRARELNGKAFDDTTQKELEALMKVHEIAPGPTALSKGLQARKNLQAGLVDEYGYGAEYAAKQALGAERLSPFRGGSMTDLRKRLRDAKGPNGEITPAYEALLRDIQGAGGGRTLPRQPSLKAASEVDDIARKIDREKARAAGASLRQQHADAMVPERDPRFWQRDEVTEAMKSREAARHAHALAMQKMTPAELKANALSRVKASRQKAVWDYLEKAVPEINANGTRMRDALLRTPRVSEVLADLSKGGTKAQGARHTLRKAAEKIDKEGADTIRTFEDELPTPANFKSFYAAKPGGKFKRGRYVRQGPDLVDKNGDVAQFKSYSDFDNAMRDLTGFNKDGTPAKLKGDEIEGGQILKDLLRYADRNWLDGAGLPVSGKLRSHLDKHQLGRELTEAEVEYMKRMSHKLTAEARAGLNRPDIECEILVD